MDNSNFESIEDLREIFDEMTQSRRHLRPILSDIATSIDKGFFIDAGSEEVNELLKKILEAQEYFFEVEQLKRAASSKKVEQVEKAISNLEQNLKRDELNNMLARIATLEVDSEEATVIDAVKKVKLQADHLRHKSGKMDINYLEKSAEKFLLLANVVDNFENFSPDDYIKVFNAFQDNPLISMVLTNKKIHFPRPVEVAPAVEPEEINTDNSLVKFTEDDNELPSKRRVSAVWTKQEKVQPNMALVEMDEKNFSIEKAQVKKQLSIKSFNKKLHDLIDSTDPLPLMKLLIKSRIFFKTPPKSLGTMESLPKKLKVFAPTILERFFNWGIVDKIIWRGKEFYFLNSHGLDLCVRAFTRAGSFSDSEYFRSLTVSMQFYMLFMSEARIKSNYPNIEITHNSSLPTRTSIIC